MKNRTATCRSLLRCAFAALAFLVAQSVSRATTINFDDATNGTVINTRYPGVTFTNPLSGASIYAVTSTFQISPPNLVSVHQTDPHFNASEGAVEAHFSTPVKAVRIDTRPLAALEHYENFTRRPYLFVYDSNHQLLGRVYYAGTLPRIGLGAIETLTFVSTAANIAYARLSCEFAMEDTYHYLAEFDNLRFDDLQAGPNYVVNTVDDHDDGTAGDSDCTLREAINQANARPGAQTITFAPNVAGAITLQLGELVINGDVTIIGPGATVLAVSGNNSSRVLQVVDGSVQIIGLTIANGRVVGQAGAPASAPGGFGLSGGVASGGASTMTFSQRSP